jgi:hypothetical protein
VARELQAQVLQVLSQALRREVYDGPTPAWLQRPGPEECRALWPVVRRIYGQLTDLRLPREMPPRERREVDGLIGGHGQPWRLVEVDEAQHFNEFRAVTLSLYPAEAPLGFPRDIWLAASKNGRLIGPPGYGRPKPPLFPMDGGRQRQRAFRDALADLLPPLPGFAPTLRIADFEVQPWIWERGAQARLRRLLEERM